LFVRFIGGLGRILWLSSPLILLASHAHWQCDADSVVGHFSSPGQVPKHERRGVRIGDDHLGNEVSEHRQEERAR